MSRRVLLLVFLLSACAGTRNKPATCEFELEIEKVRGTVDPETGAVVASPKGQKTNTLLVFMRRDSDKVAAFPVEERGRWIEGMTYAVTNSDGEAVPVRGDPKGANDEPPQILSKWISVGWGARRLLGASAISEDEDGNFMVPEAFGRRYRLAPGQYKVQVRYGGWSALCRNMVSNTLDLKLKPPKKK